MNKQIVACLGIGGAIVAALILGAMWQFGMYLAFSLSIVLVPGCGSLVAWLRARRSSTWKLVYAFAVILSAVITGLVMAHMKMASSWYIACFPGIEILGYGLYLLDQQCFPKKKPS